MRKTDIFLLLEPVNQKKTRNHMGENSRRKKILL